RREVHLRKPELILVILENRGFANEIEPEENLPKRSARPPLLFERAREPFRSEVPLLHQSLPEWFSSFGHGSLSRCIGARLLRRSLPRLGSARVRAFWRGGLREMTRKLLHAVQHVRIPRTLTEVCLFVGPWAKFAEEASAASMPLLLASEDKPRGEASLRAPAKWWG